MTSSHNLGKKRSVDIMAAHHLGKKRSVDIMVARQSHLGSYGQSYGPKLTDASAVYVEEKPRTNFSIARTPSVSTTVTNPPSPERPHLFRRLFSRASRAPLIPHQLAFEELVLHDPTDSDNMATMGPSPVTHPLLVRPRARDERVLGQIGAGRPRPGTALSEDYTLSPMRSASRLAMTSIPEDRSSRRLTLASLDDEDEDNDRDIKDENDEESISDDSSEDLDMYATNLEERERLAVKAAAEPKYIQEWGFFLKCYLEGRFNTSNPPDPPPRGPQFQYLQAPAPLNEFERLRAVKQVNLPFPDWALERSNHIVRLAMRVFQTRCASVSFFDRKYEIIKTECGVGRSSIPRKESIGAHVLLSSEPMVVLDTLKDWRLQGHPMVQHLPYTRFYAGAPLVTSEGHIVGAFTVFDPKPKSEFGINSRRRLTDFAKYAMTDVEILVEEQYTREALSRQTASEETDASYTRGTLERSRKQLRDLQKIEEDTEHCDEDQEPVDGFASEGPTVIGDHTPPVSDAEEVVDSYQRPQSISSLQKIKDNRSSAAISDLPTPPQTPARPFSTSTIGSDRRSMEPQNTPAGSRVSSVHADQASEKQRRLRQLPELPGPFKSHPEATFAAALIARNLAFDTIYLLRVEPFRAGRNAPLTTKLIVAHGMPNPQPVFDANLHLLALRSAGGLTYQNSNQDVSENEEVGYKFGILLPYIRDGQEPSRLSGSIVDMDPDCRSGVVLAAYKKHPPLDTRSSSQEVNALRDSTIVLRDIFMDADHQSQMI